MVTRKKFANTPGRNTNPHRQIVYSARVDNNNIFLRGDNYCARIDRLVHPGGIVISSGGLFFSLVV